jgi:hypothetical protein
MGRHFLGLSAYTFLPLFCFPLAGILKTNMKSKQRGHGTFFLDEGEGEIEGSVSKDIFLPPPPLSHLFPWDCLRHGRLILFLF